MWRRIKAFHRFGAELQLICWWWDTPPSSEVIARIQSYTKLLRAFPIDRTVLARLSRALRSFMYPLAILSRIPSGSECRALLNEVASYCPDIIFLDGIYGGQVAMLLSQELKVPLVTRSHNIEHLYYRHLLSTGSGLDKLRTYFTLVTLERYERRILRNSVLFYDISLDDLKFWQQEGFTNGRYLPPIIQLGSENATNSLKIDTERNRYDVVFLGNLFSANNVSGVRWFLAEVMPRLRSRLPGVRVLIAGLEPAESIRKLCSVSDGVELEANPPSSRAVYESGHVLINPVAVGSGVSIKTLEMMAVGKPIVSRSHGLGGLPEAVRRYFRVADDAQSFAEEILQFLAQTSKLKVDRELLQSLFGEHLVQDVLEELTLIAAQANNPGRRT